VNYALSRERAQQGRVEFCIDLQRFLVLQERFNEPPHRWTFTVSSLSLNEPPPAWAIDRVDHSAYTRLEWSGGPAPAFSGTDLENRLVRLSDLRGRVVVVVFWRVSCRPCVEQLRAIDDLRSTLGANGPVFISLTDDEAEVARAWLTRHELVADRVLVDRDAHIRAEYRCDELPPHSALALAKSDDLPVVVVIDGAGDVVRYSMGFATATMVKTAVGQAAGTPRGKADQE
jgi:peroxiredoxin